MTTMTTRSLMSRWARSVLLAVVIIGASMPPATAFAADDPKKEAQVFFTQGLKLAESGDVRGAIAAFRAAYDKSPTFRVLYNIAQLCERAADSACAVRVYEQYLRDGGADVPAKRRAEVEADLEKLKRTIALVTITVNFVDAEISVDDEAMGKTPLPAPVAVNAGEHKIVARYQSKSVDRSVKVAAGDAVSIDLQLPKDEAKPKPKPIATSEEKEHPPPPPRRPFPVLPWAVTGALAVTTVVTGVLAAGAYSTFKEKRDAFPITRDELNDSQGSARDLFLLTALFGTVTVVSAGVASYFTFFAPAPAASTPRVGIGPRGIVLEGTLP
jgi:hypothetical protein